LFKITGIASTLINKSTPWIIADILIWHQHYYLPKTSPLRMSL
jgi:hypothetical protein